jgi:anti-sigma B factor antagonist
MSLHQPFPETGFSDPPPGFVCVTRAEAPGVDRVTLGGELDIATAPHLEQALYEAAGDGVTLILDLSGLSFMDSIGLQVILSAQARLSEANCRLELVAGGPQVQRLFEITGVKSHLQFLDGPGAAPSR